MKNFWVCSTDRRPVAGPYGLEDLSRLFRRAENAGLVICSQSLGGRLRFGLQRPNTDEVSDGVRCLLANGRLVIGRIGQSPAFYSICETEYATNEFGYEEDISWEEAYKKGCLFVTEEGQPYCCLE